MSTLRSSQYTITRKLVDSTYCRQKQSQDAMERGLSTDKGRVVAEGKSLTYIARIA